MAVDPETVREVDAALDLYQYLQPVNAAEERERFLDAVDDGESYNPSYEYRSFDRSDAVQTALERLTETAETRLEERLVAGLRSRCRMVSAIGTPDITAASEHHYGAPRPDLVAAARELFTPPSEHGEASTGAETVVAMFNTLFDRLDVDYEAAAGDNDIIRNNPGASRILVPQGKSYSVAAAKRLLVHESTHAVRAVNGRRRGSLPLVHGTKGYETAEEGLATFNEAEMDVLNMSLPKITARVIAVDQVEKGFCSLFSAMRELGLDQGDAFIRTYRVKRGLSDTSRGGGFVKDHIYLAGYRRLDSHPGIAEQLYTGKIGFEDVAEVDSDPAIGRDRHLAACRSVARSLLP